jgi:predicted phosphodiesterase
MSKRVSADNLAKRAIIRQWCEAHPDVPHMTLARMVYAKYSQIFASANSVCGVVRRERGVMTPSAAAHKLVTGQTKYTGEVSKVPPVWRIPKSMADQHTEFVIHGAQRVLRLSDIHFPFHDECALMASLEYGYQHNPTIILLAGDILDLPNLSTHPNINPKDLLEQEFLMVAEFFETLRTNFPKARIVWMAGNHEQRVKHYMMRKAPELFSLPNMDVPGLLCSYAGPQAMTNVEWVDDCRVVRTGKLAHLHGHEFRGGGGVMPARWLYLRTGENAICGHFHRTHEFSEPSLSRQHRGAWTTGCLCTETPDWMRHTKWNHGFAWIDVEANGNFRVKNIRIIDGRVL